jgi:hypothetical protein
MGDLERNANEILSDKMRQILTFARENPAVANKSWPTLLNSPLTKSGLADSLWS